LLLVVIWFIRYLINRETVSLVQERQFAPDLDWCLKTGWLCHILSDKGSERIPWFKAMLQGPLAYTADKFKDTIKELRRNNLVQLDMLRAAVIVEAENATIYGNLVNAPASPTSISASVGTNGITVSTGGSGNSNVAAIKQQLAHLQELQFKFNEESTRTIQAIQVLLDSIPASTGGAAISSPASSSHAADGSGMPPGLYFVANGGGRKNKNKQRRLKSSEFGANATAAAF
jgi:hypothetical protein